MTSYDKLVEIATFPGIRMGKKTTKQPDFLQRGRCEGAQVV